jgi:SWI/SNF-related matrix-associated actin-dependent regulator of chromatin subfamily A3
MARKRKSDIRPDESPNEASRPPKVNRTALSPNEISTGQRFGETADFIPLPPLSQGFGVDEEDDEAADIVQDSQEVDESSLTTYILYGMHPSSIFLKTKYIPGIRA